LNKNKRGVVHATPRYSYIHPLYVSLFWIQTKRGKEPSLGDGKQLEAKRKEGRKKEEQQIEKENKNRRWVLRSDMGVRINPTGETCVIYYPSEGGR
jgi:hypothetical protein